MKENCCSVCGHDHLEELLTIPDIPVFVNVLSDTPEDSQSVVRGTQQLVQCRHCGFVFNAAFEPEKVDYKEGYHAERGISPGYCRHIQSVLDLISSIEPLEKKIVLEVACGTGEFLQAVKSRGTFKCIGIDPSSKEIREDGLEIHRSLFAPACLHQNAQGIDILINRHMIEHMLRPLDMLRLFAQALPQDGMLYLETPRLDWILENQVFFDFPYEHCAYYSDDFLSRLLAAAGFSIVTIQPSYEGQYFSLCARKCGEPCEIQTASPACLTRIRQRFSKIGQGILRMSWNRQPAGSKDSARQRCLSMGGSCQGGHVCQSFARSTHRGLC